MEGHMPEFNIKESEEDPAQFYVVLEAGNGEVRLTSETYTRELDAARAVEQIKTDVLRIILAERVQPSVPEG